MTDLRSMLIRGSEKDIAHYRLLLVGAQPDKERGLSMRRIEHVQRMLDGLRDGMPRRSAV